MNEFRRSACLLVAVVMAMAFLAPQQLAQADASSSGATRDVVKKLRTYKELTGRGPNAAPMSEAEWKAYQKLIKDLTQRYCLPNDPKGEEARKVREERERRDSGISAAEWDSLCADLAASGKVDPAAVAREVVARLRLPAATPKFGPDPDLNQYAPGDLVVRYPYWLDLPGDPTLTTTGTSRGLTLQLEARRTGVVFDMGNGDTETCTTTKPWPGAERAVDRRGAPIPSPVCGYAYPDRGTHTTTATVTWAVDWSGGGQSGTIPVTLTDSVTLDVVELHSVVR